MSVRHEPDILEICRAVQCLLPCFNIVYQLGFIGNHVLCQESNQVQLID